MAFFETMRRQPLKRARLAAFGSTRRAGHAPDADPNLRTLLEAETPVVTIFGKSWLLHVLEVLRVTPDDNLQMVRDSCAFLRTHRREVIFDAEHFFDGHRHDPAYALAVLEAAVAGGASTLVLCDTNGGMLPGQLGDVCRAVRARLPARVALGIHCHNDSECAVGNSLVAVDAGFTHVQGTINGIGERTGNTNLCSIIPALELKQDRRCVAPGAVARLCELSMFVYDLANLRPPASQPYVGASAFAHKGGMHVNAVSKNPRTFEHIEPQSVGNQRRVLVSDLSGSSNILIKAAEHDIHLDTNSPEVKTILAELKKLEAQGYQYEAADASFKLFLQKMVKAHAPFFELTGFRVIVEKRGPAEPCLSEATIKVTVGTRTEIAAAEGDGPVNALDRALRKALTSFYPEIAKVHLRDFKVRILDGEDGTAAKTRVLIESGDGVHIWGTVGVSPNIIEASWQALTDSVEYALFQERASRKGRGRAKPRAKTAG
jgi:2-isopropylmalate synthase